MDNCVCIVLFLPVYHFVLTSLKSLVLRQIYFRRQNLSQFHQSCHNHQHSIKLGNVGQLLLPPKSLRHHTPVRYEQYRYRHCLIHNPQVLPGITNQMFLHNMETVAYSVNLPGLHQKYDQFLLRLRIVFHMPLICFLQLHKQHHHCLACADMSFLDLPPTHCLQAMSMALLSMQLHGRHFLIQTILSQHHQQFHDNHWTLRNLKSQYRLPNHMDLHCNLCITNLCHTVFLMSTLQIPYNSYSWFYNHIHRRFLPSDPCVL